MIDVRELGGLLQRAGFALPVADVDRTKAKTMGVAISDVSDTLAIYLGSLYVNDFNRFGRTFQVIAQAEAALGAEALNPQRLRFGASGLLTDIESVLSGATSVATTSAY